jgi:putative component of membrane protein insertase Oxa1/YidC/SpoIIIJ protein YidD
MTLQRYGQEKNFYIDFYQNWISPVKGGNTCPMFPACSQYAKIAFLQLPWHQAYITSLERLLRCGNDLHFYPKIIIDRRLQWYDPLDTDSTKIKLDFDD